MKNYPLKVQELWEFQSTTVLGAYSKGHHDAVEFCAEVVSRLILTGCPEETVIKPENVKHEYWRSVPQGDGETMAVRSKPGKGAYPVTVIMF